MSSLFHDNIRSRSFGFLFAAVLFILTGASSASATGNPVNCWDVKYQNPSATDGNYVIEPVSGKVFTIFCADMAGTPKEFISLVNTGGDFNFGQYSAGNASPGTDVRTNYTKLRFDPVLFLIDTDDQTYATSTGSIQHYTDHITSMPIGFSSSCWGPLGLSNIDLTGTPFAVNDTFTALGYRAYGSVTFNGQTVPLEWNESVEVISQVVDTTGYGGCGGVRAGGVPFHYFIKVQLAN